MPRIHPSRSTAAAESLAQRIAYERSMRGWKQATLARKMTEVGCPMTGSTVFKIESGSPPRAVSVDELVGLSRIFDVEPSDLLLPMELVLDRSARAVTKEVAKALQVLGDAVHAMIDTKIKLVQLRRKLPEEEAIADRVASWLPQRMISKPLTTNHDEENDAPDPVGDAWLQLDKATTTYALWFTAQDWTADGQR